MGKYAIADDVTRKMCATCEQVKPLSAYYATRPGGTNPRRNCIPCHLGRVRRNDEIRHERIPQSVVDDPRINRASGWRAYGATEYEILVLEFLYQNGTQCDICGEALIGKQMKVDHCHDRRRIRGVLCHRCNVGLGYFNDNVEGLQAAIGYLTSRRGPAV